MHPSLHEGFGLTPLEAMTTGTPVIAARSPGVTEVCGEAVLYADPRDPEDLAQQLTRGRDATPGCAPTSASAAAAAPRSSAGRDRLAATSRPIRWLR